MKKKAPAIASEPIQWPRADPKALENFDPRTKLCTMNCGPHTDDPRSPKERKYLCGDCMPNAVCDEVTVQTYEEFGMEGPVLTFRNYAPSSDMVEVHINGTVHYVNKYTLRHAITKLT